MEWIRPTLLWGLLGLLVPVMIHLWNRKKERVIYWAAMTWLNQEESQSSRSLKLENWILLVIRMILLFLLVVLLAGIFWKGLDLKSQESKILHLVLPEEQVVEEFRFELAQAKESGQSVFWLASGFPSFSLESIKSLEFSAENLQSYLDEIPEQVDSLYIYTSLESSIFPKSTYWVPVNPKFKIATISKAKPKYPSFRLGSGEVLTVDQVGNLVKLPEQNVESSRPFEPISVAFIELTENKKVEILRALTAIQEVYGLTFQEVDSAVAQFIFSDILPSSLLEGQFLFLTGNQEFTNSNQKYALASSSFQTWDQITRKGILPELILAQILKKIGFENKVAPISFSQLEQKFQLIPTAQKAQVANTNELILALFLGLFFLERFLAYRTRL